MFSIFFNVKKLGYSFDVKFSDLSIYDVFRAFGVWKIWFPVPTRCTTLCLRAPKTCCFERLQWGPVCWGPNGGLLPSPNEHFVNFSKRRKNIFRWRKILIFFLVIRNFPRIPKIALRKSCDEFKAAKNKISIFFTNFSRF